MFYLTRSNAVHGTIVSVVILICLAALALSWKFLYPDVVVGADVIIPLVLVWCLTTMFLLGFTWCIHEYDHPPAPSYDSQPLDTFIDRRSKRGVDVYATDPVVEAVVDPVAGLNIAM